MDLPQHRCSRAGRHRDEEAGLALYRSKLAEIAAGLGPEPVETLSLTDPAVWREAAQDRHIRFLLEYNARRLAVVDRDVEAIIATHVRDRKLRCPMLSINPKMLPRLDEIEDDLLTRRARAEHEAWLGEVEGIDLTLTFLRQKRQETKRLARVAPVELGMPSVQTTPATRRG